jgi:hypothetical protein
MPTPTYTPLANITLGSTTTTVTFSSISAAYRDLVLVSFVRNASSDSNVRARFNGDSGSNYTYVRMFGTGSGSGSSDVTTTTGFQIARQTDSSQSGFGTGIAHIMDYSATDKHKTVLVRADNGNSITMAHVARWANTAAITSIVLTSFEGAGGFATGSSFSLYGIVA